MVVSSGASEIHLSKPMLTSSSVPVIAVHELVVVATVEVVVGCTEKEEVKGHRDNTASSTIVVIPVIVDAAIPVLAVA